MITILTSTTRRGQEIDDLRDGRAEEANTKLASGLVGVFSSLKAFSSYREGGVFERTDILSSLP